MRSAVGITVLVQGSLYFTQGARTPSMSFAGLLAVVAGALLVAGFCTAPASGMTALGLISAGLSWIPEPDRSLLSGALPTILLATVAAAVLLLGPGALSVDARLFGRREIIIPHQTRPAKP